MAHHTDMAGDQLWVGKRPSGIVTLTTVESEGTIWLHEDQVKELIDDLAAQIGYRAILSPDAVTGWTSVTIPPEGTPSI